MKQVHSEMLSEINQGGAFCRDIDGLQQQVAALDQEVNESSKAPAADTAASTAKKNVHADGGAQLSGQIPKLTAIANFDPPNSQQSKMLPLIVGDTITVIGQDGKGWWYGSKQDGTEGWFPPSYVQTKAAHFSSPGVAGPA